MSSDLSETPFAPHADRLVSSMRDAVLRLFREAAGDALPGEDDQIKLAVGVEGLCGDIVCEVFDIVMAAGEEVHICRLGDTKVAAKDGAISAPLILSSGDRTRFLLGAGSTARVVLSSPREVFGARTEPEIVPDQARMEIDEGEGEGGDVDPETGEIGPSSTGAAKRELEEA